MQQPGVTPAHLFASEVLEASSRAFANQATNRLLERDEALFDRFGSVAPELWKKTLLQHIQELSAAVLAGEPGLFTCRVRWAREAMLARGGEDVDLQTALECLRETLKANLPGDAKEVADSFIGAALEGFQEEVEPAAPVLDPHGSADHLTLEYLTEALEGDAARAVELILGKVEDGQDPQEIYKGVLMAAQRRIGDLWHAGEVSIAEEHLVTATTRQAMTLLAQRFPQLERNGKRVVFAAIEGDGHDLGVRAAADFFQAAGWSTVCLGANVPSTEIRDSIGLFEADMVVISATLMTQVRAVRLAVRMIRESSHGEVKVILAGRAFDEAPWLWRTFGADGYASSPEHAIEIGEGLLISPSA